MSTIIKGQHDDFIEKDCVFNFQGKKFESSGSYLVKRIDTGLREGVLYHFQEVSGSKNQFINHFVGSWDGSIKVHAVKLNTWRSNFGDERSHFYFKWIDGKKFWGINAGDNDIVRCREYKRREGVKI